MAEQPFETRYPHLFSPLTIKGRTLKNRVTASPQGMSSLVTPEGFNNREASVFFGGKARGGAAVVTLSEPVISPLSGCGHNAQINLCDELTLRELNQLSDFVHTYGGLLSAEITHCGQWAMPACNGGRDPMGPTARTLPNGVRVEEMSEADMDHVAQCYADACVMARRGGADMANIHGGHGWLLHQFLSPLENQRADKYGGSLENRARFPILVLDRIRKAMGPDFLLEYRVSASELCEGGMAAEETAEFVRLIEDRIDLVQCSVGTRRNPTARGAMHPGRYLPQGCNVYGAEAMKRAGVKIPVVTVGGIGDPAVAERILAEGKADMVALVRALIADPDWAEKARAGRGEDIRPCIKCMRCLDAGAGRSNTSKVVSQVASKGTKHIECSVNPFHGRAWMAPHFPVRAGRKRIAVVGGGPAGMEAALRGAALGWEVVLYEKTARLGGLLNLAEGVDFKEDLYRYRDYLVRQVGKSAVDVRLDTAATPEGVGRDGAGAVIVAVGSEPFYPPIPGLRESGVLPAASLREHLDEVGDEVVVIGGGLIGCESAIELLETGRRVSLLELGPVLAPDAIFTDRLLTMHFLEHGYRRATAALLAEDTENPNFTPYVNTRCTAVEGGVVRAVDGAGAPLTLRADTVLLAAGMAPRAALRDSFRGAAFDVINVGDCVKASHIQHAVRTACDAVLALATRNVQP